jgi:hypothetical protein
MNELKPCPFCGKQPTYWKWNYGAMVECHQEDHRVQCEAKTMDEAVGAWNQRAGDAE